MAIKDKIKWNKKYQDTPHLLSDRKPCEKLTKIIDKIKGNKALEIACGTGRNSIYLAQKGFTVDALDISEVALENLNSKNYENITTKLVDLDQYIPSENSYNFIVITNFLNRNIIPLLQKALKKDGIFFIETYMNHNINEKPS